MRSLLGTCLAASLSLASPVAAASPFALPAYSNFSTADEVQVEADPNVAAAQAEYKAGSDAYALGNYELAVDHFERAYELSGEPALLFNIGQAYTRWYDIDNEVDHLKKARRLYENYVLNVGATNLDEEDQAEARADAQHRIREVDRRIAAHEESTLGSGPSDTTDKDKPAHKKAWFWLAVLGGAAVIGGVTTAVVLTTRPKSFEPELGTIGNNQLAPGGLSLRF